MRLHPCRVLLIVANAHLRRAFLSGFIIRAVYKQCVWIFPNRSGKYKNIRKLAVYKSKIADQKPFADGQLVFSDIKVVILTHRFDLHLVKFPVSLRDKIHAMIV